MTSNENQPSKFVTVFNHPASLLVLGFVCMLVVYALSQAGMFVDEMLHLPDTNPIVILAALLSIAFSVSAYWLFVRFVERKPFTDFARTGAAKELAIGIAVGFAMFSAVVAVLAAIGDYHVLGMRSWNVLMPAFGMGLITGVGEEILFRGVFFRYAEAWLGSWIALGLSAALFGAVHIGNPNATVLAAFAIAIEAGIMLAAIYMITRRLWAAIGLHFAWNFTQGGLYGIAVSGNETRGLIDARTSGPELLTGGSFGAEASLPAMLIATGAGLIMLVIAHRSGKFVAPRWVRQRSDKAIGIDINAHAD